MPSVGSLVATAAAAAAITVLACCVSQDGRTASEPEPEPEPEPELEPEPEPEPQEAPVEAMVEDDDNASDASEEGQIMMSMFDGSDDDDLEDQLPPAKLVVHAASGTQLRAFGMEFGHTTGLALWPAATITAESFMRHGPSGSSGPSAIDLAGRSVLELGAGLALPSIVAAKLGGARCVVSTDYPDELQLANISHNAGLNLDAKQAAAFHVVRTSASRDNFYQSPAQLGLPRRLSDERSACERPQVGHLWGSSVAPLLALNGGVGFDVIVLTDLIYKGSLHAELLQSVGDGLAPGSSVSTHTSDLYRIFVV